MRTYWLIWFITMVTSFLVPETVALVTGNPQNTLSAAVWSLEKFVPGQPVWNWTAFHLLFIGVLLVFDIWLMGHFAEGWWR